jgi:probable HAF family extracellular repeat protein
MTKSMLTRFSLAPVHRMSRPRLASARNRPSYLGAVGLAGLAASLVVDTSASSARPAAKACSPSVAILKSPRVGSQEVQAKAVNDRGDVVGFADSSGGNGAIHAILWRGGTAAGAVDLGVLPGYVSSEAYGVNNKRVVFGLLYDRQERMFPFRWEAGRMTVLKGPNGKPQPVDVPDRNTLNERGEIAATLVVAGQRKAVRWSPDGEATLLPALPGHTWTNVFSINGDGVVSGWSRKLPNEDGAENPVIWDAAG